MKLIKQKDPSVELESLPANCTCVGQNAAGLMLFQTSTDKAPTGFVAAELDDVIGIDRYNRIREGINNRRNGKIVSGVEVDSLGKRFDTDDASVKRVSGACILAMMPMVDAQHDVLMTLGTPEQIEALQAARATFKESWITEDNAVVEVGFDELKAIALTVANNEKAFIHEAYAEKMAVKQTTFDSFNTAAE